MTRVLSALVLLPIVIGTIWWLPPMATLVLAVAVAWLASGEFARLASALDAAVLPWLGQVCTVLVTIACVVSREGVALALAAALVTVAVAGLSAGDASREAVRGALFTLFGIVYIGVPLGLLVDLRMGWGPGTLLVVVLVVMVSDSAQYYAGRLVGRRPLAPLISPRKTIEGALGGVASGAVTLPLAAAVWLIGPTMLFVLAGMAVASMGILGDLFESQLKRAAAVKDASNLIPGHGGMLDRIDGLLFAAPVYYLLLFYGLTTAR